MFEWSTNILIYSVYIINVHADSTLDYDADENSQQIRMTGTYQTIATSQIIDCQLVAFEGCAFETYPTISTGDDKRRYFEEADNFHALQHA